MASGDTKTQQYLDIAANGTRADLPGDGCCNTRTQSLILGVAERIMNVEDEVEEIKDNPDVADIVATYADLQAYDTSKLTDKDIIRVLADETHDGQSTYYRYNKQSDSWTYIGAAGDYYTKAAADLKFQDKLTAGANVSISAQNVISATDTTYSNFTGTDGTTAGVAGLVPAPTTTDGGKFLKGDGSWGTPTDTTYTAGTNVQISSGNVISATDTTYSAFTGTDGTAAGSAGLVPAPATTDAGKFLKSDGTWATAGGGGGGAIELTSADYDYPDANPTGVALWRKPAGVYWNKQGVKTFLSTNNSSTTERMLIVSNSDYNYYVDIVAIYGAGGSNTYKAFKTVKATGAVDNTYSNKGFLLENRIQQTTGTSTTNVMSQKAVTDIIGDVATALNAINNGTGA